jgi:predicted TPR repeat methyltransferase
MALTERTYESAFFEGRLAHTHAPVGSAADVVRIVPAGEDNPLKVVVTMPAYHAGRTLERTLADLPTGLEEHVIVVDDASTDDTVEVARNLGLTVYAHEVNRGYGGNQKTCYQAALDAGADIVVMLHPDHQYNPRAVPLLLGPILSGDADMTFGSRFAGMADPRSGGMPWYRYAGNRVTTTIQNQLLGTRFSELHSGMRAYSRACLQTLPFLSYSDDFDFDAQLLCDAITSRLNVVEIPIPTSYTADSSSIGIAPSLRYVSKSISRAAQARTLRGRRGRRSPLGRRGQTPRRLKASRPVEAECPTCGPTRHGLVYPSNVEKQVTSDEFTCTSADVARYDDIVQCTGCGILRSLPDLTPEQIHDVYADTEDEVYLDQEQGRRELFSWVLDRISGHPVPGDRLVEFGSHLGLFLDEARSRGWRGQGVEPSQWAVEEGRRRFDVDLVCSTLESFEPDETADVVVMNDVLEHVTNPIEALEIARRTLHDDGLLAVSTINIDSIHGRLRKGDWPWMIRPHIWYYTPETLLLHLEQAGFRAVEWRTVPRSFNLSYILQRGGSNLGPAAQLLEPVARHFDPRLPVGWLGDIVLVTARAV